MDRVFTSTSHAATYAGVCGVSIQPFLIAETIWVEVRDGNDSARQIFDGHYSRYHYADGRKPRLFVGPGEKMVLLTPDARAMFVWRKFISADKQDGVNCAVFRNEGAGRASDLIREADVLAWQRWPGARLYTYVDPKKVRRSRTPGRCFLKAGWRYVRDSAGARAATKARGLLILECSPEQGKEDSTYGDGAKQVERHLG